MTKSEKNLLKRIILRRRSSSSEPPKNNENDEDEDGPEIPVLDVNGAPATFSFNTGVTVGSSSFFARRAYVRGRMRGSCSRIEEGMESPSEQDEKIQNLIRTTLGVFQSEAQNTETETEGSKARNQSALNIANICGNSSDPFGHLLPAQPGEHTLHAIRKSVGRINSIVQTHVRLHIHLDKERVVPVIMRRSDTVEDLAAQIEATAAIGAGIKRSKRASMMFRTEFAKQFEAHTVPLPESPRSPEPTSIAAAAGFFGKSLSASVSLNPPPPAEDFNNAFFENEDEIPACRGNVVTMQVFALNNKYNHMLPFDAFLEDVVDSEDHLYVGSLLTEVRTVQSGALLLKNGLPVITNNTEAMRMLYMGRDRTLKLTLEDVLSNHTALALFREFCIGISCLEYLMFCIEIELLHKQPPAFARIMALYIYVMYIARNAPLRLEIREPVREEITRAILACDNNGVPQTHAQLVSAFDGAQLSALYILRRKFFPSFTATQAYKELSALRETDPVLFNKQKITHGIASNLKPDFNNICEICKSAEDNLDGIPPDVAKEVLNKVIKSYFPAAEPIVDYKSNAEHQVTTHATRELKEKRLLKFFGNAPAAELKSFQDLLMNQMCDSFPELDQKITEQQNQKGRAQSIAQGRRPLSIGSAAGTSSCDNNFNISSEFDKDLMMDDEDEDENELTPARMLALAKERKQQSNKLSYFFGESVQQNMISSGPRKGTGAEAGLKHDVEKRELTGEEKAVLTRRRKKLQQMLGVGASDISEVSDILRETHYRHIAQKESTESGSVEDVAAGFYGSFSQKNVNDAGDEINVKTSHLCISGNADEERVAAAAPAAATAAAAVGCLIDGGERNLAISGDDEFSLEDEELRRERPEWLRKREKLGQLLGETNVVPNKQALGKQASDH